MKTRDAIAKYPNYISSHLFFLVVKYPILSFISHFLFLHVNKPPSSQSREVRDSSHAISPIYPSTLKSFTRDTPRSHHARNYAMGTNRKMKDAENGALNLIWHYWWSAQEGFSQKSIRQSSIPLMGDEGFPCFGSWAEGTCHSKDSQEGKKSNVSQ